MKKAVLISMVLMMAGLASAESEMGISKGPYSLLLPVGWIAQNTGGTQEFILYSPLEPEDTFQENCVLTVETPGMELSVEQYMASARDQLAAVLSEFELMEEGADYHIYGAMMGDTALKQIQYVQISRGTVYVLTFSSDRDNFARYRPVFEKIARSFAIK